MGADVAAARSPDRRRAGRLIAAGAFLLGLMPAVGSAQDGPEGWIGTWTASPQAPRGTMPASITDSTVRQIVRVTAGGAKVRVRISNEFGPRPVLIGAARVAQAAEGPASVPGTDRVLTFGGRPSIVLPPGAPALSDPVDLDVPPLSNLAISLYLPGATELGTVHQVGLQTAFVSSAGDLTGRADFPAADRFAHRLFLTGVLVQPRGATRAIVAFGDSITDGTNSTVDSNNRWPDILARRLAEAGMPFAVLNQGISGNRVLSDGAGASALARFDRDVLSHPGVTHMVVLVGINDIGWPGTAIEPSGVYRSADEIIAGYRQMIERAHLRGVKVIGSPLTPFENAFSGAANQGYWTPDKEAKRKAVNAWIRTSGAFDGLIDFEAALRDPAKPDAIRADFDSGDHLHPNDAGYRAMGEAVDLKLFQ